MQELEEMLIVCIYVDDIIYTGSSKKLTENFKELMMKEFEMSDLGLLHYFLGLEVHQTKQGIFISQGKYVYDLLKKFRMSNCNATSTPMNANERLTNEDGSGRADAEVFRSIVGGLIYLTHTRPDIVFAVSLISRFMHSPTRHHLGVAKRILRYVRGTMNYGIWYYPVTNFSLIGFTDSDWAGSLQDRKSTTGYIFNIGCGAICWSSKKQETVALSSAEAEYVAAASTTCQAVWMRRILEDLHQSQSSATELFCDNKASILMAKNPVFHGRTKHIEIKHHFIREAIANGIIELKHCSTIDQVADGFTKALSTEKFLSFRNLLGVTSFASRGSVG